MKVLLGLLVVMIFVIVTAFAGPYFEVEQNPIAPETSLLVGWDFLTESINLADPEGMVSLSGFSVAGDFYVMNDNLWVYPTPWVGGYEIELLWKMVEFSLGMDVEVLPLSWPDYVLLDEWVTTMRLTGLPSEEVTIWAEVEWVYNLIYPPFPLSITPQIVLDAVGVWTFAPKIGLSCHW